jgi:hypothetical protein
MSYDQAQVEIIESNPLEWEGNKGTAEEMAAAKNLIKQKVTEALNELVKGRLWKQPIGLWQEAFLFRGKGTTVDRKYKVDEIYHRYVPLPEIVLDKVTKDFLDELKALVSHSIDSARNEILEER